MLLKRLRVRIDNPSPRESKLHQNMSRGIIVLYFELKPDAHPNTVHAWAQQLQKAINGVNCIRRVEATDTIAESRHYRSQLLLDLSNIAAFHKSQILSLQSPEVIKSDWLVYREISKDLRAGVSDTEYPPTGTTLIQVGMDPTLNYEPRYHAWFDEEHLAMLGDVPGWRSGSRYSLDGKYGAGKEEVQSFMSANEYEKENGLGGAIWQKSIDTPWSEEVMANLIRPIHRRAWIFVPLEGVAD